MEKAFIVQIDRGTGEAQIIGKITQTIEESFVEFKSRVWRYCSEKTNGETLIRPSFESPPESG